MRTKQSGATVVVVISVIATLAVFTGAALDYTFTVGKNVERTNKQAQAAAIANGCLQEQFMYWREICRAQSSQGPGTTTFSTIPLPTTAQFPNIANFTAVSGSSATATVSNYGVTAVTPQLAAVSGTAEPGTTGTGADKTYYYRGSVTVTLPDRGSSMVYNAAQVFQQQYQSPWDWALFFADPLEIEPGPLFTIDGWVQTNSNLYTPLSTLTFGNKVTYGQNWYISTMPGDTHLSGDTIASPNWQTAPPVQGTPGQPFGLDGAQVFNTQDANTNNNGYHELIEIPDPHYPDPVATQRYFDNAGVKIILNTLGTSITATIYDNSVGDYLSGNTTVLGNAIGTLRYNTSNASNTLSYTGSTAYQAALFQTFAGTAGSHGSYTPGALILNQSLQDNRENQTVAITSLNVATLNSALQASSTLRNGFNNDIYITDNSSTQTAERGIEITNGATLPTNGLTVASDNPVYIQGDFNTGNNPPSDSGNTSQPLATGYTWQPASIIADAVDVLSNNWTNANSFNSLGSRVANNTTINAAIMAGNVPTTGDNYSGGAENFPRFLEDWSNATLTYYGSMVELYASETANGLWGQGNVYNPPTRAWHYDTNFQSKPPPGTIMVVTYSKGQWYQQ